VNACVFCRIVARVAPATIVSEDPSSIAIVPLNPVVEGHLLVLPRLHVVDATEIPSISGRVMEHASQLAHLYFDDANIITSIGPAATQTVRHLHLHVVPRREGDGLHLPWTGQVTT
jgi:histidine triad (HIT) family protein